VGLFLVICLLLIVGGVVLITGLKYEPRVQYYIPFRESVLGLSTGGLVEYMGVPVGSIADIVVRPDKETGLPVAYVTIEIIENKVTLYNGTRAQIVLYSLATGTMAISLKDGDPSKGVKPPGSEIEPIKSLVETVSSEIEDILDKAKSLIAVFEKGLAGIEEGDLTALIQRAQGLLKNGEEFVGQLNTTVSDLKGDAEESLGNFKELTKDVRDLVAETNKTVVTVREKVAKLNVDSTGEKVDELMEGVRALVERLSTTAEVVENLAKSAQYTTGNVEHELSSTLGTLSETLNTVRDLVEYLQRDPSALVRGRGRPVEE